MLTTYTFTHVILRDRKMPEVQSTTVVGLPIAAESVILEKLQTFLDDTSITPYQLKQMLGGEQLCYGDGNWTCDVRGKFPDEFPDVELEAFVQLDVKVVQVKFT